MMIVADRSHTTSRASATAPDTVNVARTTARAHADNGIDGRFVSIEDAVLGESTAASRERSTALIAAARLREAAIMNVIPIPWTGISHNPAPIAPAMAPLVLLPYS